MQLTNSTSEYL